jgi:hypothetical protein
MLEKETTGLNEYSVAEFDGKWRYARKTSFDISPYGACAECPGHDDKLGAINHQRQHLLGNATFETFPNKDRCRKSHCHSYTPHAAVVGHEVIYLCDDHRNQETVEQIYEGPAMSEWL